MTVGVALWAIIPELMLAGFVLILLPLGSFLPAGHKGIATWVALAGLVAAAGVAAGMLGWPPFAVFFGTYAVDPYAVYFKLYAIAATAVTLLATHSRFRGRPREGNVPAMLVLACAGIVGLAASQNLVLIALFIQIMTVPSYILAALPKAGRRATEGAVKLFLFSAAASAVMLYGMSLFYGLTGALDLPALGLALAGAPALVVLGALGLILAGYGFEITLVPLQQWAPDAYQGATAPIAAFISVGPKAGGLAVLLRTLVVALPGGLAYWPELIAGLAAATMTVGNLMALRQTSAKRLLAYSSIAQAGYLLVGVATAQRSALAIPGFLIYLAVYLLMNLGAFLAVDAVERSAGSDDLELLAGLWRRAPLLAVALTLALLSLAGIPPLGGFIGKTVLLAAALQAGWVWLAVILATNVVISLYYYVRAIVPLYRPPRKPLPPPRAPLGLRIALVALTVGTVLSGALPQALVALAQRATLILVR